MKEVISFKIDSELKEWFTNHTKEIGSSKAEIMELLLIYYKSKVEGTLTEEIF